MIMTAEKKKICREGISGEICDLIYFFSLEKFRKIIAIDSTSFFTISSDFSSASHLLSHFADNKKFLL